MSDVYQGPKYKWFWVCVYVYTNTVCVYMTVCVWVGSWSWEAVCSENSEKEDTERKLKHRLLFEVQQANTIVNRLFNQHKHNLYAIQGRIWSSVHLIICDISYSTV